MSYALSTLWYDRQRYLPAVLAVAFMTIINLRGVKESGRVFAVPTYFFLVMLFLTLGIGFFRWATGTLGEVQGVEMMHHTAQNVSAFLILHAFSSGCTALTGVEAISNGVTVFKEPRSKNAAATMAAMSAILGTLFIGITVLAYHINAVPSETETIISQLGRTIYGNSPFYGLVIAATTVILIMAANTAYADFPRLCALHAGDGFLPRQLTFRGSRLVFSWGILVLALASIALIVIFNAKTSRLIPLYAIGVFLSFTLSQAGMVMRWRKIGKLKPGEVHETPNPHGEPIRLSHDPHWRAKQLLNGFGACMTFVVMWVFAITKFSDGAWVTVILIPTLVMIFSRIHKHYTNVARLLSLSGRTVNPVRHEVQMVLLIDDVHAGTVPMIEFAMSYGDKWMAVHVDDNPQKTEMIQAKWQQRMGALNHPLTIVPSPYRNLTESVVAYVEGLLEKNPRGLVHIVMGQLIMDTWQAQMLHANTSIQFKLALQAMERVIVTDVSYPLHTEQTGKLAAC